MNINYIDIFLIIIVLLAVWSGYQKGFIVGVLQLLSLVAGLVLTFMFYKYAAVFFDRFVPSLSVWSLPLAFILTLIVIRLIISAIVNAILRNISYNAHTSEVNRVFGVFPGFVNGVIYAVIISALLLATPLFDGLSEKTKESQVASRLSPFAEWIESKLSPVFDEAVKKSMNKMIVDPNSKETIKMPFTVDNPKVREDLEVKMLQLVNEERAKEGLSALKPDPEMTLVARKHSVDMFARGYFSHVTPEGKDPFDRMKRDNVKFLAAGENLAYAQTLRIAHTGLMNSPGHRANILRPQFRRLGIGVLDGGIRGLMITQNFRN
jgi:uncharacterized protein YkwD